METRQETMQQNHLKLVLLVLALGILVGGCQSLPIGQSGTAAKANYTGFLEGDNLDVAPEVGGKLVEVPVREGDTIQQGQVLFKIQDDLMAARIKIADANVANAKAQLALLETGARKEDVARAQAQLDQSRAALDAATTAQADTEAIRANPQSLLIAQAQAQTRSAAANQQLAAAVSNANAADKINSFWEAQTRQLWDGVDIVLPRGGGTLHFDTPAARLAYVQEEWNKAGNAAWQAWAAVKQAQANATAADAALKDINNQIANPIVLDTKVDQARAAKDRAAAGVASAEAALKIVQEGASPAQIATARAAVDQAVAARASLDQDMTKYKITAAQSGKIDRVYYRFGEMALPGVPVVGLSISGDMTLRVFVAMSVLDNLRVGDQVTVRVEGIDNQSFPATISRINDTAEFAGRQVQTDNERNAQLVAVEMTIKNGDGTLKPGMPATVLLGN